MKACKFRKGSICSHYPPEWEDRKCPNKSAKSQLECQEATERENEEEASFWHPGCPDNYGHKDSGDFNERK